MTASGQRAGDAARRLAALYGPALAAGACEPAGVVHVAAVWRRAPDDLAVLRIGPDTPASEHDALALATARARADAIVVEAGPTTARALYPPAPPAGEPAADADGAHQVDELMLSVYHAVRLPDTVCGPAFPSPTALRAALPRLASERAIAEPSGPWRILRRTRARVAARAEPG